MAEPASGEPRPWQLVAAVQSMRFAFAKKAKTWLNRKANPASSASPLSPDHYPPPMVIRPPCNGAAFFTIRRRPRAEQQMPRVALKQPGQTGKHFLTAWSKSVTQALRNRHRPGPAECLDCKCRNKVNRRQLRLALQMTPPLIHPGMDGPFSNPRESCAGFFLLVCHRASGKRTARHTKADIA